MIQNQSNNNFKKKNQKKRKIAGYLGQILGAVGAFDFQKCGSFSASFAKIYKLLLSEIKEGKINTDERETERDTGDRNRRNVEEIIDGVQSFTFAAFHFRNLWDFRFSGKKFIIFLPNVNFSGYL